MPGAASAAQLQTRLGGIARAYKCVGFFRRGQLGAAEVSATLANDVAKLVAVDATAATGLAQQFGAETPFETNSCCAVFLIENDHFPRHALDK